MTAIVKIVWDSEAKKLRATPIGLTGWVRFPRALRIQGATYQVETLLPGKSGSWIASGKIERVEMVGNEYNLFANVG